MCPSFFYLLSDHYPPKLINKTKKMKKYVLWGRPQLDLKKALVAWKIKFSPKSVGGLGLRRYEFFN
jgi:hypothetical protein